MQMNYNKRLPHKALITFLLSFVLYSSAWTQISLEKAIASFNSRGDSLLYFNQNHIKSIAEAPCCNTNFNEIQNYLAVNKFLLFPYNSKQYVIIDESSANLSLSDLINIDQFKTNASQLAVEHIVVNQGDITNGLALISGTIKDQNEITVIGANIIIENSELGTSTDGLGQFKLSLAPGNYSAIVSAIGYIDKPIKLTVATGGMISITMLTEAIQLNEVIVSDRGTGQNVRTKIVGLQEITVKQMKLLPALMGQVDVLKSLTLLAGVSSNPDGVGGLNIRGSNADQNLIIQNDMVYYNPSHALGFISSFMPEFVGKVQLFKGYIPPKYGGRIASVISTETRPGNFNKFSSKVNLGFTNSGIFVEGPIKNNTTSIAVGGRVSHANWLLNFINVPDNQQSKLNFYDGQIKVEHKLNSKSNIGAEVYQSEDYFLLLGDVDFDYKTQNAQAYYRTLIGRNTNLTIKALTSTYKSGLNELSENSKTRFESSIRTNSAIISLFTNTGFGELKYGADVNQYVISPGAFTSRLTNSPDFVRESQIEKSMEIAPHIEISANITNKLSYIGGVRWVNYISYGQRNFNLYRDNVFEFDNIEGQASYTGNESNSFYTSFEPRLGLIYALNGSMSLKTGITRNFQYLNLISNTVAATPIDFWKSTDLHFKPIRSDNIYLGYYMDFLNKQFEFSSEVYYSRLNNTQEYKDFADLLGNETLETEILFGRGKNYGWEVSLKKLGGKVTGNLSYTLSRSLRQIDDPNREMINFGSWYPSIVDKPHNINMLVNFNVTKRLSFNFNFAYMSGRPLTVPVNKYEELNIGNVLYFGDRNSYRMPDYHRLDFSLNLLPSYNVNKKVKQSWNFTVLNLYARKNPYSVFFRQNRSEPLYAFKYSILGVMLPSLSLNLEIN
jgi:hypothetical protein